MALFGRDQFGRVRFELNNVNISYYFSQFSKEEYENFNSWVKRKLAIGVPKINRKAMKKMRKSFHRLPTVDPAKIKIDFSLKNFFRFVEIVSLESVRFL